MAELKPGIRGELRRTVTPDMTAGHLGSGGVQVLATPYMIAMMEGASYRAVQPYLAPGQSTVGTQVNVRHLAATPLGMEVRVEAELLEVEGRRLLFAVTAYDEREKIGEGSHERFIIDVERFKARTEKKGAV